ncbi:hypothetical protein PCE1_001234 [Barthelona sp. PCE]
MLRQKLAFQKLIHRTNTKQIKGRTYTSGYSQHSQDAYSPFSPFFICTMPCVAKKILQAHCAEPLPAVGNEIMLAVDLSLKQDATGTAQSLELELLMEDREDPKEKKVKPRGYIFIDHNMQGNGYLNHDDHVYLRSIAERYSQHFFPPGSGIIHQLNIESCIRSGEVCIGTDSHTPSGGGVGAISIGVGGLDSALVDSGSDLKLVMPKIVGIRLVGKLPPFVSAKDIILQVLRERGSRNKNIIYEYFGEGIKELDVAGRATITNMGAEAGVTTSLFPSDEITKIWFEQMGRPEHYVEILADDESDYEEILEIDLSKLRPNVSIPHQPHFVKSVDEFEEPILINQVIIGSCTNASYRDLMTVAALLKGKTCHPEIEVAIAPGSRTVLETLARNGALADLIASGCRILESGCGPCIGMGLSPTAGNNPDNPRGGRTLRSFNRNFFGRCGHKEGSESYLASPETCAAAALTGYICGADSLGMEVPVIPEPVYNITDNCVIKPDESKVGITPIIRGPNIKPIPPLSPPEDIEVPVILKCGDDITTDDIMPAGAKILPLRSNVPAISKFVFVNMDPTFHDRALEMKEEHGGSIIIGGEAYGSGSSREHAALCPSAQLGVRIVIAKDVQRIFESNACNWGQLAASFEDPADYDRIEQGDILKTINLREGVKEGTIKIRNVTKDFEFNVVVGFGEISKEVYLAGGLINYAKK